MVILTQSTITIAQNSLKKELKQIEAEFAQMKDNLIAVKNIAFPFLQLDQKNSVNKNFSKTFSKLEKKKVKIVAALTELKKVVPIHCPTEDQPNEPTRLITHFYDMEVGSIYEIVDHSNEKILKDVWIGCHIARIDDEHFHFLTESPMGYPDVDALNQDVNSDVIEKCSIQMKFVSKIEPKTYTLDEIEIPENIGKKFKVIDGYSFIDGKRVDSWLGAIAEVKHSFNNHGVVHRCVKSSPSGYPSLNTYWTMEYKMKFVEATKEDLQ